MHDLQSSTNENAERLASFPDPRFRIVSEWPTTRELMTTRAFIGSNPPTRRHYFRFARHSAAEVSRCPPDRFASLRFPHISVDNYALLR